MPSGWSTPPCGFSYRDVEEADEEAQAPVERRPRAYSHREDGGGKEGEDACRVEDEARCDHVAIVPRSAPDGVQVDARSEGRRHHGSKDEHDASKRDPKPHPGQRLQANRKKVIA